MALRGSERDVESRSEASTIVGRRHGSLAGGSEENTALNFDLPVRGRLRRRRALRVVGWLGCAALVCAVAACSSRSEEQRMLPWFKLHTTFTRFGSFAATPSERTYSARHFGVLWLPVPDVGSASVVSDDLVLVSSKKGTGFLRRGDFMPVYPCRLYAPWGLPPSLQALDCLSFEGPMGGPPERVVITRTDVEGAVTGTMTLVAPKTHRFHPAHLFFYDPAGRPYMVATSGRAKDYRDPVDCVLVGATGEAVAAHRDDLSDGECMKAAAWSALLGRSLIGNAEVLEAHYPARAPKPLRACQPHEARNVSCR
jgi:hypothetical protein